MRCQLKTLPILGLVQLLPRKSDVGCRCVYNDKWAPNEQVDRDYRDAFSLVAKMTYVRLL